MVRATDILYYTFHFGELRSIIQWKTWHMPVHERNEEEETESLRACFKFLDQTSRSFASVIKELHSELLVPIALFYLVLRGLDTIEDDMTITLDVKDPMLRDFHSIIEKEGWTFDGCGPHEADRELLVQFSVVTEEFRKIKTAYKEIIQDIAQKMGSGMADYCNNAEHNTNGVNTVKDYDLYCHYVAGLVGNGLTRLFVESGLANPVLLQRPQLQESMGLFLQKTNIIRDVREDWDDSRRFWPKEIWSKHVKNFDDLFKPEYKQAALDCSSEMVLNALYHADECLFYLAGIKEQSVFNFAAIPQTMAIATLELVFRNPELLKRNVKITKGEACRIMTKSTQNLQLVCELFREFTRKIHKKNTPRDPNFLKISIQCGRIEQFIESIFPTQDPAVLTAEAGAPLTPAQAAEAKNAAMAAEAKKDTREASRPHGEPVLRNLLTWIVFILAAVIGTVFVISLIMIVIAYFCGARFDLMINELTKGNFLKPAPTALESIKQTFDHTEL